MGDKLPILGAAQSRVDFLAKRARLRHVPLRQQPRMDQDVVVFDMDHRTEVQPVDQLVAIRRDQNVLQRVAVIRPGKNQNFLPCLSVT